VHFAAGEFRAVLLKQVKFGSRKVVDTARVDPLFEAALGGLQRIFEDVQVAGGFAEGTPLHLDADRIPAFRQIIHS